jgi:hypothetical protein
MLLALFYQWHYKILLSILLHFAFHFIIFFQLLYVYYTAGLGGTGKLETVYSGFQMDIFYVYFIYVCC